MSLSIERRVAPIVYWTGYAVLMLLATGAVFMGASLWLPIAVAALPWFLVIWSSRGAIEATAVTVVGVMFFVLAVLSITHPLGLPIVPAVVVACVLVAAGGVVALRSTGRPTFDRGQILPLASALLGGVVWAAVVTAALWIPGAAHYVWSMAGDSANNLLFAREVGQNSGIVYGGDQNPVPLTAGILFVGMAAGRAGVGPADLTRHDLTGFVDLWTMVIVVLCVLSGIVACARIPAERWKLRSLAALGGSLIPLSWYIVGYPIEFGFLNTHLALLVILSGWIIYRRLAERPAWTLAWLAVCATLTLAVWTPLVLFPVGLMVVLIVRHLRALLRTRGLDAVLVLAFLLVLVAFGAGVSLPALLVQAGALANPGGAFPISRLVLVALMLGAIALAGLTVWRSPRDRARGDQFWGVVGLVAAAALGWAALLYAARTAPDPWISYYPLKFSWIAGVVLFLVIAGDALAFVALATRRMWVALGAVVVGIGSVVGLTVAPWTRTGYVQQNPVQRVLAGNLIGDGDELADRVFRYADLEAPTIMWRSGSDIEGTVNFWVMQIQSNSMSENIELKVVAYGDYDVDVVEDLCRAVDLMGAPTTVVTADPGLSDEVSAACPSAPITVRVE